MKRIFGTPMAEYLLALGLWLLSAAYLAASYRYKPGSAAMPIVVGWSMIVIVGLDLLSRTGTGLGRSLLRWLNPAAEPAKAARQPTYPIGKQIASVLWIAGFTAALALIGIYYAVPLYVFAFMRLRGKRSLLACVAGAGGATLFIGLLFSLLLRLDLFPGILFGGI